MGRRRPPEGSLEGKSSAASAAVSVAAQTATSFLDGSFWVAGPVESRNIAPPESGAGPGELCEPDCVVVGCTVKARSPGQPE